MKYCENCGNEFERKDGRTRFCSRSCSASYSNRKRHERGWRHSKEALKARVEASVAKRRNRPGSTRGKVKIDGRYVQDIRIIKECPYCKEGFETSEYKPKTYCGRKECLSRLLAKKKRSRRSFAELRLQKLLSKVFEVKGDDKKLIGRQLDILVVKEKVAIEWDGVFHWRPVFGKEHFDSLKAYDRDKEKQLNKIGWRLIRVKDETEGTASKSFIRLKFKKVVKAIKQGFEGKLVI